MSDEEIINEAKRIVKLTSTQGRFLLDWYNRKKDQEFGFKEVRGFQEQLKMAIDFYLKTQREWQDRIQNNRTSLDFNSYFLYSANSEGINLSDSFINKLQSKKESL